MKIDSKIACCTFAIVLVGGVDAGGRCETTSSFNCGVIFPQNGNTCSGKGCCCDGKKGTGMQVNTCTNGGGFLNIGCESCWGNEACRSPTNMNIGSNSCHGKSACYETKRSTIGSKSCIMSESCRETSDSTILSDSCYGSKACKLLKNSSIGYGSCNDFLDEKGKQSGMVCLEGDGLIIGNNSCTGLFACSSPVSTTVGSGSCNTPGRCNNLKHTTIGNNSCNAGKMCVSCDDYSNVPDNACYDEDGVDTTLVYPGLSHGYRCNYCMVCLMKKKYKWC